MNIVDETKLLVRACLIKAFEAAQQEESWIDPEDFSFVIERPNDLSHGDFATNMAMQLARPLKKNPRLIAETLIEHMVLTPPLKGVAVAGPGFINFTLEDDWIMPVLAAAQEEDLAFGSSDSGSGERILVEFVSANPTGLLHMGNARGGALGDSLAAVLNAAGYVADKEYYINDTGNQVNNLALSVEARYYEALGKDDFPLPEDGYKGDDIKTTAAHLLDQYGEALTEKPRDERLAVMTAFALQEKVGGIQAGLDRFGVTFDRWYSEKSLHESGQVLAVVEALREKNLIDERDGAIWLKSTSYGEEKDEVLVRQNGMPTYFAADIAYHKEKFDRGYDRLIDIWGADHHGHVARLKNALTALDYPGENLTVILMQLVRLYRDGEIVKMSKRSGQYVTLEELIDDVGRDAARFFFVMRSPDSPMDFDLDLAKKESQDNPVYYVQYAHARICSLLSVAGGQAPKAAEVNLALLIDPAEKALLEKIAFWPEEVAEAARELSPYRLAYYAKDLANTFHSFYNSCKVLTSDAELQQARLVLVDAARITLRNVLTLLGVTASERM